MRHNPAEKLRISVRSCSDLINLSSSVDHANYLKGVYMASQSVHDCILGQKDAMGRPYYLVDPAANLLMVNGKPLYVKCERCHASL